MEDVRAPATLGKIRLSVAVDSFTYADGTQALSNIRIDIHHSSRRRCIACPEQGAGLRE